MPIVPNPMTEIIMLMKAVDNACRPSAPNQRSVETLARGAKITDATTLIIAEKMIITRAKKPIAINFPASTRKRPGWRTKIFLSVP